MNLASPCETEMQAVIARLVVCASLSRTMDHPHSSIPSTGHKKSHGSAAGKLGTMPHASEKTR
jgi:hypothetical protein